MKKIKKWLWLIVLAPFVLFLTLALLLYVPAIQNWAVKHVAAYVSDHTDWNASVGSVHLAFPLDIEVNDLHLTKVNDSVRTATDTVACVEQFVANIELCPLLSGNVVIEKLNLRNVKLNTVSMIPSAKVRGTVGQVALRSKGIDLRHENVDVIYALLQNASLDVALNDTVPEDTSTEKSRWKIALARLHVVNTSALVHMPGDTLAVRCVLGDAVARNGQFDLEPQHFSLSRLDLKKGKICYDNKYAKPEAAGLDVNHLALSALAIRVDSFFYSPERLTMGISKFSFREKCGFCLSDMSCRVLMDTARLNIPSLSIVTPASRMQAKLAMDLNAFADTLLGSLSANLNARLGFADMAALLPYIKPYVSRMPYAFIDVKGEMKGNMQKAHVPVFSLQIPGAMTARADGWLQNLTDIDRLKGHLAFAVRTQQIDAIRRVLPAETAASFRLPNNMALDGKVAFDGARYNVKAQLREGGGNAMVAVSLNTRNMAYDAKINAHRLQLGHFLPGMGLQALTGQIAAAGRGTDMFAPHTVARATASVSQLHIDQYDLSGLNAELHIGGGKAHGVFSSDGPLFDGHIVLEALLQHSVLNGTLSCQLDSANFQRMGITKKPLNLSMKANLAVESDFNNMYRLQGAARDILIADSTRKYRPEDLLVDALTRRDTTFAHITSGDFSLRLNASGGYKRLLRHSDEMMAEVHRQMEHKYIDQLKLRSFLPTMCVQLSVGQDNMFARAMNKFGVQLSNAFADIDTSPLEGINGVVKVDSLVANGIQLDTIRMNVVSDSTRTDFKGQIRNNRNNPQYVFNALFGGTFYERGLYFGTRVLDAKDRVGVALGLKASMESNGVKVSVGGPFDTVLGYKKFSVNKDNYVFFSDDSRISADVRLRASDGMGLQVYTNDSTEALQDLTVGLTKFELASLMTVLPYLPRISGVMNGDFHVIKTETDLSVSSSIMVNNMTYEGCKMGNIGSEFVYMPKENNEHYVDGTLSCNNIEVGTISGTYSAAGQGALDANLTLSHTPLSLLNGFITDQLFGFKGYCDGDLKVEGPVSKPKMNGELRLDSAYIESVPYGVELRFDTKTVTMTNSRMTFDDYRLFARNRTPLVINGYLDLADMANMYLSTRISTNNFLLIDAREKARSEAYGKAYVNFLGAINGPVDALKMRGKLDVLGATDMTYILRDSPLTTDTQLDDLVKFTNFKAKKEAKVERPAVSGLDMDLTLNIDEGAHIMCALNTNHSNYVDLIGGGSLRMQYGAVDGIRLTGRYTLSNGEMKYSLPVIPLKTFTIQDGSYVEFFGDMMNPKLNITAIEETKAQVADDGGTGGRNVTFECGVKITKTLQDMGLEFIIDAPEDLSLHNELQTMTKESRGKLAVTMLTTGMYLADGNTNAFSMNSALSAFLNSQINSISGSALRTLDLSFGMDNTTVGTGETHTDYSFKFSKRFWNNRLRIVIGGKVSSGAEIENQNDTFFDNVTFEYRLSPTSNKYLKLFYDKARYDWLEGNVEQFGAGFMYRKKIQKLTDIFNFKRKKSASQDINAALMMRTKMVKDSTKQKVTNDSIRQR